MTSELDASEVPSGWAGALHDRGLDRDVTQALVSDIYEQKSPDVRPARRDVFRALHLTPLEEVRVVILGQDPYPSPEEAHGLAFSVPAPLEAPRSLRNIYRNLEGDSSLTFTKPGIGDLTPWATNGVLLLNTALTVSQGIPGSHARRWAEFTDAVLRTVAEEREHVAFLLWGSHAIRKAASIPIEEPPHKVIRSAHPAARGRTKERRFSEAVPFSEADDFLRNHGQEPVPWAALNPIG